MAEADILTDNDKLEQLADRERNSARLARVALDDLGVVYSRILERTRDLADDADRLAFALKTRINREGPIVPLWADMMDEIGRMHGVRGGLYTLQQMMTYGIYITATDGAWRAVWGIEEDSAFLTFESTQAKALARAVVQRLSYLIYGTDPRTLGAVVVPMEGKPEPKTLELEFAPAAPETPDGEVINAN